MDDLEIRAWLISEADEKYQKFASSLLPNIDNVLGVRLPKLRKKAKELAKICVVENLFDYKWEYFEEVLLLGMIIGELKLPFESHLELVRKYVPLINNWSVCDSFCVGLKFVKKDKVKVWEFLQSYLNSEDEFELRFGVVMILNYFVEELWIDRVLDALFKLNSDKYYAQMGIAWAISVCLMKYFDKTYEKLSDVQLSPVIFKKSIQKGCESYRLTYKQKMLLKSLV